MKFKDKTQRILIVAFVLTFMVALIIALFCHQNYVYNDPDVAVRGREQSRYNFLVLGRDSSANLCDVIILASIDFEGKEINVMQIPRDTYFDIDGSHKKINGLQNVLNSADAAAKALGEAMSINIDYYLSLDLDTLARTVDSLSGIEVDVPFDMSYEDKSQNLTIDIKAGKQTLDGKSAVQFLRYRSGYITGDLGRINAQKLFLNALFKKMGEIGNPFTLYKTCSLLLNSADTNIKEQDVLSMGLKYNKLKGASVKYMTAPGEAVQDAESGAWYYVLSKEASADILSKCFGLRVEKTDFDKNNKFVDKDDKSFYDIYNKYCEVRIYSADDVENNEVNIN